MLIIIEMIRKLPQNVINKIAAGEVIQRPYNVIKEMIENSIDAGATAIHVSILNGGIQSIEIKDNGKGIAVEDYPLLCQRFATSKLNSLDDLLTIASFGFRGEALASLSYVSQLQVLSKHSSSQIGYRCSFKDEQIIGTPEPVSINTGTTIIATNLFSNLETRRSSLSGSEEKKRVVKLIGHLSLHYNNIKISLESEKGMEFVNDFRNLKVSESKMKIFQVITKLPYDKFTYLPKQILEDIKIQAIITKLNTIKGKTLLLNVNHRIIDNPEIYKIIEKAYSQCYQSIHADHQSFCVYLAIELDQKKIDCNVHPSKKMVNFFAAEAIYQHIYKFILEHIKEESSIKNMASNIVSKGKIDFSINRDMIFGAKNTTKLNASTQPQIEKKQSLSFTQAQELPTKTILYPHQKIRTDARQIPINFYLKTQHQPSTKQQFLQFQVVECDKTRKQNNQIRQFFKSITYVGCFNLNYIFIQVHNQLYILNILPFLEAFVKEWIIKNQLIVHQIVDTENHISIKNILNKFVEGKNLQHRVNIEIILQQIYQKREFLRDKYGFEVILTKENQLLIGSLPLLVGFMSDCMSAIDLAYFLCRLFVKQNSRVEEEQYFIDFLCSYFEDDELNKGEDGGKRQLSPMNDKYSQFMRDQVIPLLKTKCKYYKSIEVEKYMRQMLDLREAYKIFERC